MGDVLVFRVDPDKKLDAAFKQAMAEVDDLTIPLTLITRSWFKSNRAIFSLKGPGKYADLSEPYKIRKEKEVGFIYPILVKSGALANSMINPGDPHSVSQILDKQQLILGTSVSYGYVHQYGSKKKNIPSRPFVLVGGEQAVAPEIDNRREAWIAILNDYVMQVAARVGQVSQ